MRSCVLYSLISILFTSCMLEEDVVVHHVHHYPRYNTTEQSFPSNGWDPCQYGLDTLKKSVVIVPSKDTVHKNVVKLVRNPPVHHTPHKRIPYHSIPPKGPQPHRTVIKSHKCNCSYCKVNKKKGQKIAKTNWNRAPYTTSN